MIPTAFSATGAIYCEIVDKPADSLSVAPTPSPHFRRFRFNNVHSSGRDKYAPPAWRPFDAPPMSKRGGALQRCNAVPARQQKERVADVVMTKPAL